MIFVRKINQHQILRPKIDTEHIFQQISHLDPLMGIRFCPKSRVDSFWIVLANHKRRLFSFMGYVKRVCLLRLFFCNDICDPPHADTLSGHTQTLFPLGKLLCLYQLLALAHEGKVTKLRIRTTSPLDTFAGQGIKTSASVFCKFVQLNQIKTSGTQCNE